MKHDFAILTTYAAQHELTISAAQYAQLDAYLTMLQEWNEKLNLTAITDPVQMVSKHLLDAMTYLPLWAKPPKRMLDVGSGAGIPGLVLAILWPTTTITLVESITKKCTFLQHVVDTLPLPNVTVISERAEVLGHQKAHRAKYDFVTARAVAELRVLAEYLLPFCAIKGVMYAPKGPEPEAELKAARHAIMVLGGHVRDIVPIEALPLEPRTIIRVDKTRPTPEQYPRSPGTPAKRPL